MRNDCSQGTVMKMNKKVIDSGIWLLGPYLLYCSVKWFSLSGGSTSLRLGFGIYSSCPSPIDLICSVRADKDGTLSRLILSSSFLQLTAKPLHHDGQIFSSTRRFKLTHFPQTWSHDILSQQQKISDIDQVVLWRHLTILNFGLEKASECCNQIQRTVLMEGWNWRTERNIVHQVQVWEV